MELVTGQENYSMETWAMLLDEHHVRYSIDEVASPAMQERFLPFTQGRVRFIDSDAHYWIKFTVKNRSHRHRWLLTSHYPWLNWFHLYRQTPQGTWAESKGGMWLPKDQWPYDHRLPVHALDLADNQEETFYLYVYGATLELWLHLETPEALAQRERNQIIGDYSYLGMALIMALYNLFLAFSFRSKTYFAYVGYVVFFAWGNAQYAGQLYGFMPSWPRFHMYADLLAWSAAAAWGTLFSLRFIGLHLEFPKVYRYWLAGSMLVMVPPLANYYESKAIYYQLFNYYFLGIVCLLYALGIRAYRKGFKQARYFLAGWGMVYLGAGLSIGKSMSWLPQWEVFDWSRQLSAVAEFLLLSIALADRVNIVQAHNLRLKEQIAEGLKAEVEARTTDLEHSNFELATANQELLKLAQEQDEFLSITAHDLKTPLGGIRMASRILASEAEGLTPADRTHMLELMEQNTGYMLDLINNLLRSAQLEHRQDQILLRPVPLEQLWKHVAYQWAPRAQQKDISLTLDTVPQDAAVMGNQGLLIEVIDNLVSNAVKYCPKGSRVSLETELLEGDWIRISVLDEGPGIPKDKREKLFQKFGKIGTKPTGGETATGLGLFIVSKLTESMHGEIGYAAREGRGSQFFVEFQMALPAQGVERAS